MGSYDATLGTLLVGIFLNTFLYGLVTYQFAAYWQTGSKDRLGLKCMVVFLYVLDTFHSASAIYMAWNYTVTNYGNPAVLAMAGWPLTFTPIATSLAAFMIQIYLGFRIWGLTRSTILYGIVVILAIPPLALAIASSVEALTIKAFSQLPRTVPLVTAWLSTQVIVDVFITAALVTVFSRLRTGFLKTDSILNRLIRGAIQSGFFAVIFSLADLITFVALPNMYPYGMFAIPLGRIYTNTFLDTLLTRESLNAQFNRDHVSGAPYSLPMTPADLLRSTSVAQTTYGDPWADVRDVVHETRDHAPDGQGRPVPLVKVTCHEQWF